MDQSIESHMCPNVLLVTDIVSKGFYSLYFIPDSTRYYTNIVKPFLAYSNPYACRRINRDNDHISYKGSQFSSYILRNDKITGVFQVT